MKNLFRVAIFVLISGSAQASEIYQCRTDIPSGAVQLRIDYAQGRPSRILFTFKDRYSRKALMGKLLVDGFDEKRGSYRATGIVRRDQEEIAVSMWGSIEPDPSSGRYAFSLLGSTHEAGPNPIDFGYGNRGSCERVQ